MPKKSAFDKCKRDGGLTTGFQVANQVAQTEQGKSEVSCVLEEVTGVIMGKPMIITDDTPPTHFTFANQVGVQTDASSSVENSVPDELGRTIESHFVACQLGTVSWHYANHVNFISVATSTTS